jgi:predicted kinase
MSADLERHASKRGSIERHGSPERSSQSYNPLPQNAPGASAAKGHTVDNSIPLSIFPISIDKLCICFCGLPGRGKTHIARRLARYLSFFHAVPVEVFSAADIRRKEFGALKDADWYNPNNQEAQAIRATCNRKNLDNACTFLQNNVNGVAIIDASNPTHQRRLAVKDAMFRVQVKVLFLEVFSDDEKFLNTQYSGIRTSPDYTNVSNIVEKSILAVKWHLSGRISIGGQRFQCGGRFP